MLYKKDSLKEKLDQCSKLSKPQDRGKCFEDFVSEFVEQLLGLRVLKRNVKSYGEIDILAKIDENSPLRSISSSPYVCIECKFWSNPIGDEEVSKFLTDVERLLAIVQLVMFFAVPCLTSKAWNKLCYLSNTKNLRVLVFEQEDILELLYSPITPSEMIDRLITKIIEKCRA